MSRLTISRRCLGVIAAVLLGGATLTATAAQHAARHVAVQPRFGAPAVPNPASRVIRLDNDARWINVTQNETVRIERNGQAFTWQFSTWATNGFDLATIAPPGFVPGPGIWVYVAPEPGQFGG
jgi:hypothetical protein